MADNQSTIKLHILLEEEEKISLTGLLFPDKTQMENLVWSTDNGETAAVSEDGTVTGIQAGTAKITVRTADSGMEDSVMVLVMGKEETGLRLSILLKTGEKCRLTAMFGDEQGMAVWASADESVAVVDEKGRVTAAAAGTALITVTSEDGRESDQVYVTVRDGETADPTEVYGVRIDKNNPDPSSRVTYLFDAEGKQPAGMNYETGTFDYGGWADAWFVKKNRPCMLKYDGTVDYYLDPDDYSKRADGTDSDVADMNYAGNAMAEFPLIWMKQYEEDGYEYILVSDRQADGEYHAYPYTREDGSIADKVYLRMFESSFDGVRMRSISGGATQFNTSLSGELAGAEANGNCWTINAWCEWDMISALLTIISKSTDSQQCFGHGSSVRAGDYNFVGNGTLNTKGQFFGYGDIRSQAMKVFHLENWWGDVFNRIQGLHTNDRGELLVKMSPPYDNLGNGYYNTKIVVEKDGYQSKQYFSPYGKLPVKADGSETTYYCDYIASGANGCAWAGGDWGRDKGCGASMLFINYPSEHIAGSLSACLSARPPQ